MICSVCEREYGDLSQNVGTCPACLGDEPPERMPLEPDEADWVTEDFVTFWEHEMHKPPLVVPEGADWMRVLKDRMDRDQFWPNVWHLGERGDWNIIRLKDG